MKHHLLALAGPVMGGMPPQTYPYQHETQQRHPGPWTTSHPPPPTGPNPMRYPNAPYGMERSYCQGKCSFLIRPYC